MSAASDLLRKPDIVAGPFREQDSALLTMVFVDNTDTPIPGSSLTTATLTLYSEDDEDYVIINSRDRVDITANIGEDGVFTFALSSDDMAIIDDDLIREQHRALIEWTWPSTAFPGETERGSYEIRIVVKNLEKVPA